VQLLSFSPHNLADDFPEKATHSEYAIKRHSNYQLTQEIERDAVASFLKQEALAFVFAILFRVNSEKLQLSLMLKETVALTWTHFLHLFADQCLLW
jgi:hypothetical protein